MGKSKMMTGLAWLLIPAAIASAHPPHVEPYKYTISYIVAAIIAIASAVISIKAYPKKWFLGVILGILLFVVCAYLGGFAAIIVSM